MPRRTNTKPVYGAPVATLGSGATPSIWGFLSQKQTGIYGAAGDPNQSPDPATIEAAIAAALEAQCCIDAANYCEQFAAIDTYMKRLTNILTQLHFEKSVPTTDQRLDLIASDIRARIAKSQ